MARLVTHAEVSAVPDGGTLRLQPDDQLTPLAEERARARGVAIDRSGADSAPDGAFLNEVMRRVSASLGGQSLNGMTGLASAIAAEVAELRGGPAPSDASFADIDFCAGVVERQRNRVRRRAVLTTTGRNRRGIVARLTGVIAERGGDILDISQTLVGDYFTMILVVDTVGLSTPFADFKAALEQAAGELGLQALVMHEDIVTSLQQV